MRYKVLFSTLISLLIGTANANWLKINDVDYTWGPFNIYHITLFTETGQYEAGIRPLMLTLQYKKPWAGRDFAVSLARTWKNLGIELPENEVNDTINKLRRNFPDIKPEDTLHYIALEDKGYFILNDKIISEVFDKVFNDAIVSIWLDPKMDISHQLLDPSYKPKPREIEAAVTENAVSNTENHQPESEKTPVMEKEIRSIDSVNTEYKKVNVQEIKNNLPASQIKEQAAEQSQSKEKQPKLLFENPEIFISPIYDNIRRKNNV